MSDTQVADEQKFSSMPSPLVDPTAFLKAPPQPRILIRASLSSDTFSKSSKEPFWVNISLCNGGGDPITVSKTTRLINLPSALHTQCIVFRDISSGTAVPWGATGNSEPYRPSDRSGIPKRWHAKHQDLITIPANGFYTCSFRLSDKTDDCEKNETLTASFVVGKRYEMSVQKDCSIMYWNLGSAEDILSNQDTLGPNWPEDHLALELMLNHNNVFRVVE